MWTNRLRRHRYIGNRSGISRSGKPDKIILNCEFKIRTNGKLKVSMQIKKKILFPHLKFCPISILNLVYKTTRRKNINSLFLRKLGMKKKTFKTLIFFSPLAQNFKQSGKHRRKGRKVFLRSPANLLFMGSKIIFRWDHSRADRVKIDEL